MAFPVAINTLAALAVLLTTLYLVSFLDNWLALTCLISCLTLLVTDGSSTLHRWIYRSRTIFLAMRELYYLPQEKINDFMGSYELFGQDHCAAHGSSGDTKDAKNIKSYYSVLNHLCSIGEVEKMYIPPILDPAKSIIENQILFERKIMADLGITEKSNVLDVGCGRGRVLAHIAMTTGARASGINIDTTQLDSAVAFAKENNLSDRLTYKEHNFNDPLPFEDETFDALYQIQVLTYADDKKALFSEMFRVLKPGGKLSFLDWVKTENYHENNSHHRGIMDKVKPLIGAVDTPTGEEFKRVLEECGFIVTLSKDISENGHQADLIESADDYFVAVAWLIKTACRFSVLPAHFQVLFDRLTKDGASFIEGDRMGLFTTSFQTLAQKPMKHINH
jgi:sterol 24-C-methyltransferase